MAARGHLSKVQGTIADQKGTIWMASFANDSVHVFPKGDPNAGYPAHTVPLSTPFQIQIDDEGFGWVSYESLSRLTKLAFTKTSLVPQFTVALGSGSRPKEIGLDSRGNTWVAAGAGDAVYAVDNKGGAGRVQRQRHPRAKGCGRGLRRQRLDRQPRPPHDHAAEQ